MEGKQGMWMRSIIGGVASALLVARAATALAAGVGVTDAVVPYDNTRAAGVVDDGTMTIRLRAASGLWRPEGAGGPALTVEAFGEEGASLTVPAPLIRVTEGTTIVVSVRNDLTASLRVHGLCAHDRRPCQPLDVPPGGVGHARFSSGRAGTYHYWATTMGAPVPFRELAGALVVDPPGAVAADRIFVITEWSDLSAAQLGQIFGADDPNETFVALHPKVAFVINGLSWPATERLTYRRGEAVRWRVINLSSQIHPLHLHGFYFTVTHIGDGRRDEPVDGGAGRRAVTHVVPAGGTIALEWTPEREGHWLFHCHIMHHVSPERRIGSPSASTDASDARGAHHADAPHDPSLGMAGMVLGITVLPSHDTAPPVASDPARIRRHVTLVLRPTVGPDGRAAVGASVSNTEGADAGAPAASPGPPLVLERGQPVDITIVNALADATSIHWHGLELESYYDGVHGWSGTDRQVAPMIPPGGSFVARITPPRAGTFIYHTHLHDYRQLTAGLYGALVVTEPGETFDPATDHVVVLGRRDASEASSILEDAGSVEVNGARAPRWTWRAGARHRVRVINITPDDILNVSLLSRDTPVTWRPLTKDGAPISGAGAQPVPATLRIAVGETYDFEYEAPLGRTSLWLDVRASSGKWQAQGQVIVK